MWFKQIGVFQLTTPIAYDAEALALQLQPLAFTPCLPSFHASYGWVSPDDQEQGALVYAANGYMMICLQFEEKILPANVIRQELLLKIKEIEEKTGQKISTPERLALKDTVVATLLPRAFTKLTKIHAYIDTKNQWLIINSVNEQRIGKLMDFLKRSAQEFTAHSLNNANLATLLTQWLVHNNHPATFSIEKSCVLTDPNQQTRIIRCQQQDLSANCIQLIIKDGCEVKQLALSWQERVNFVLTNTAAIQSIKFLDGIIDQTKELELETKQQQFDADFIIMVETLKLLLAELFAAILPTGVSTTAAPITHFAEVLQ